MVNRLDDGGYQIRTGEFSYELFTPTFEGWESVPLDMMHIVCDRCEDGPCQVGEELSMIGLDHLNFRQGCWSEIKGGFGWRFTILVSNDDTKGKHPIELLLAPYGSIFPFYNHKDLKMFYIREVLGKQVTL